MKLFLVIYNRLICMKIWKNSVKLIWLFWQFFMTKWIFFSYLLTVNVSFLYFNHVLQLEPFHILQGRNIRTIIWPQEGPRHWLDPGLFPAPIICRELLRQPQHLHQAFQLRQGQSEYWTESQKLGYFNETKSMSLQNCKTSQA